MNVPTTAYGMHDNNDDGHSNNQHSFHIGLTFFADNGVWVLVTSSFIAKETRSVQGEFFEIHLFRHSVASTKMCVADTLVAFFDCPFPANKVLSSVEGRVNSGGVVFFFSSSVGVVFVLQDSVDMC